VTSVRPYTVAVLEDDPSVLRALGRVLAYGGHSTELYASPEEVTSAILSSKADCWIIDCQLGTSCGIEFAKNLFEAGMCLPIIFMTASDGDALHRKAIAFGCIAFLQKPFFAQDLLEAVGKAKSLQGALEHAD
jgi:FixJ family two-component response regulator